VAPTRSARFFFFSLKKTVILSRERGERKKKKEERGERYVLRWGTTSLFPSFHASKKTLTKNRGKKKGEEKVWLTSSIPGGDST